MLEYLARGRDDLPLEVSSRVYGFCHVFTNHMMILGIASCHPFA
jgi:hypothetical protein